MLHHIVSLCDRFSPDYVTVVHSLADYRNAGSLLLYASMVVYGCWAAYGSLVRTQSHFKLELDLCPDAQLIPLLADWVTPSPSAAP